MSNNSPADLIVIVFIFIIIITGCARRVKGKKKESLTVILHTHLVFGG